MLRWKIQPLTLDLKYTWKISRNASDRKTNLIVSVDDGIIVGKGEAAPNVRYHETAELGLKLFENFSKSGADAIDRIDDLRLLINTNRLFRSLSFAIESAWIHYAEKKKITTLSKSTGVQEPGRLFTSYTIPIMETGLMKNFYKEHHLDRFPFIKLKVNSESATESIQHLLEFCTQPIMVDANESFDDVEKCISWLEKIRRLPLVLLEQPLPAARIEESIYLKKYCPFILFADESMTDNADFGFLRKAFDGVNMKLMKAGGYLNGIRLLKEARQNRMKTMIGCMVETTLGIASAMRLGSMADYIDLDSFMLVVDEPFGMVQEEKGELILTGKEA